MEWFWPVFFLLVVLKIPVFGALWLVWWASRAPDSETAEENDGDGFNRWRPSPYPRRPNHDPSGGAASARRGRGAPPAQRRPSSHTAGDGARVVEERGASRTGGYSKSRAN